MPYASLHRLASDLYNGEPVEFTIGDYNAGFTTSFVDQLTATTEPVGMVVPSAPTACNKTTGGALNFEVPNASPNTPYVLGGSANSELFLSAVWIIDRLSHQGGLVANTTATQTTNLPTAALTRYTNGIGVMIGITIYSSFTLTTTISLTYTNQSGVNGRTSPAIAFSGNIGNFYVVPLQQGDTGVRSVESVTLAAASANVGNFGIMLFKPVCMLASPFRDRLLYVSNFINGNFVGGIPSITDNSCITALLRHPSTASTTTFSTSGYLTIGVSQT